LFGGDFDKESKIVGKVPGAAGGFLDPPKQCCFVKGRAAEDHLVFSIGRRPQKPQESRGGGTRAGDKEAPPPARRTTQILGNVNRAPEIALGRRASKKAFGVVLGNGLGTPATRHKNLFRVGTNVPPRPSSMKNPANHGPK